MAVTRDEHLAFCKRRALEYVDAGMPLAQAVASMGSDLMAHPETIAPAEVLWQGALLSQEGDPEKVRRWIEAFK